MYMKLLFFTPFFVKLFFTPLLVIMFLLSNCQHREESPHVKHAHQEINKFKKTALEKYDVSLIAQGRALGEKINGLSLTFHTREEKSLDEMRNLIVHLATDFLMQINSNNEIKKYFVEYPFDVKNLNLIILSSDLKKNSPENLESSKEKIATAILIKNNLCYSTKNNDKENFQETFQEALEKVQSTQSQLTK